jgi:uncharacterized protein GlcG (DUF336 family)
MRPGARGRTERFRVGLEHAGVFADGAHPADPSPSLSDSDSQARVRSCCLRGTPPHAATRAEKARADPVERASFDPFFTFFLGGGAVFEDGRRVGAVGVSGLPGEVDEQLALAAIKRTTTATA